MKITFFNKITNRTTKHFDGIGWSKGKGDIDFQEDVIAGLTAQALNLVRLDEQRGLNPRLWELRVGDKIVSSKDI